MEISKKEILMTNVLLLDIVGSAIMKAKNCSEADAAALYMNSVLNQDVGVGNVTIGLKTLVAMCMNNELPAIRFKEGMLATLIAPYITATAMPTDTTEEQWLYDTVSQDATTALSLLTQEARAELVDTLSTGAIAKFNQYVSKRAAIYDIVTQIQTQASIHMATRPHLLQYINRETLGAKLYPVFDFVPSVSKYVIESMFEEIRESASIDNIRKLALAYKDYGYEAGTEAFIDLKTEENLDKVRKAMTDADPSATDITKGFVLDALLDATRVENRLEGYATSFSAESVMRLNALVQSYKLVLDAAVKCITDNSMFDLSSCSNIVKAERIGLTLSAVLALIRENVFTDVVLLENGVINGDRVQWMKDCSITAEDLFKYRALSRSGTNVRITTSDILAEKQSGTLNDRYNTLVAKNAIDAETEIASIKLEQALFYVMQAISPNGQIEKYIINDELSSYYNSGLSVEDAVYKVIFNASNDRFMISMHNWYNTRAIILAKNGVEFTPDVISLMDGHVVVKTIAGIANETLLA